MLKVVEGWLCQDLIQHPCRNLLGCNGLFVPLCSVGFICSLETFWFEEVNLLRGLFFSPFLRNIRKFSQHRQLFHKINLSKFGQIFCSLHFEGSLGTPKFRPFRVRNRRLQNGFLGPSLPAYWRSNNRERSEIWFQQDLRPPTHLRHKSSGLV